MKASQEEILAVLKRAQNNFVKQYYQIALDDYLWLEQQLEDDPQNLPVIWLELSWCYYLLRQYDQALTYLQKALQASNLTPKQKFDCLRLSGFCYEYLGNPDKAIAFLQDALRVDVEETGKRFAYFELGKLFFVQNLTGEGKPYLEKALSLFGEEEQQYRQTAQYYLGFIAFFERENQAAEQYFTGLIRNGNSAAMQASGHFGLAHLQYHQKDFAGLKKRCQTIMELDPNFHDKETAAFFLCRSFVQLEEWEALEKFLPNLIEGYPEGRYKAAYPTLRKALAEREIPEIFRNGGES